MSELRARMLRDMTVRGFSRRTHEAYVRQVVGLARYYRRSPDQLSADEVQAYLALLFRERQRSWSTCAQAAHAFRFFYHVTLGREKTAFHVPAPKSMGSRKRDDADCCRGCPGQRSSRRGDRRRFDDGRGRDARCLPPDSVGASRSPAGECRQMKNRRGTAGTLVPSVRVPSAGAENGQRCDVRVGGEKSDRRP